MLILLIFILVFAAGFVLPWWTLAIISFAAAWWLARSAGQAFSEGFLAVFVAWVIMALIKDAPNEHILSNRIAAVFHLPNWMAILAVTGLIGGLVGALAALSGYYCRQAFVKPKSVGTN